MPLNPFGGIARGMQRAAQPMNRPNQGLGPSKQMMGRPQMGQNAARGVGGMAGKMMQGRPQPAPMQPPPQQMQPRPQPIPMQNKFGPALQVAGRMGAAFGRPMPRVIPQSNPYQAQEQPMQEVPQPVVESEPEALAQQRFGGMPGMVPNYQKAMQDQATQMQEAGGVGPQMPALQQMMQRRMMGRGMGGGIQY